MATKQQNLQERANLGQVTEKICKTCGTRFVIPINSEEEQCLSCKLTDEMHLPENTIVNQNVLNIYLSKKFDTEKGVDPTYLKIAEGVALTNRKRKEEQLCSRNKFFGTKTNSEIEKYVDMILKDSKYKSKYDAFVFIKIHSQSDFLVFGISWSDRMEKKLQNEDILFRKNYAISIAVNWYFKE